MRTTPSTSSGERTASSTATWLPIECPTTIALGTPRSSSTRARRRA
ncbi:hypothetical protein Q0F99_08920 [Rathayibacter oskolensis]|nr:hypothetical protein [Rathayibacter oskolensis]WKK72967.1 hypothetical protein Q0F99_08920 [Rathayibacter oskolensis]